MCALNKGAKLTGVQGERLQPSPVVGTDRLQATTSMRQN